MIGDPLNKQQMQSVIPMIRDIIELIWICVLVSIDCPTYEWSRTTLGMNHHAKYVCEGWILVFAFWLELPAWTPYDAMDLHGTTLLSSSLPYGGEYAMWWFIFQVTKGKDIIMYPYCWIQLCELVTNCKNASWTYIPSSTPNVDKVWFYIEKDVFLVYSLFQSHL